MNLHGCDSLFGLVVGSLWLMIVAEDVTKTKSRRYPDKTFPRHNIIFDRNVTCSEPDKDQTGKFVYYTWTCKDIRVNNKKLAYGYYPGIGVDSNCNETGGIHEFAQLCRELLKKIDVTEPFHSLYVPDASCGYTNQSRALLNQTEKGVFSWKDHGPGHGWINTIQCMILKPGKR